MQRLARAFRKALVYGGIYVIASSTAAFCIGVAVQTYMMWPR